MAFTHVVFPTAGVGKGVLLICRKISECEKRLKTRIAAKIKRT